MNDGHEQVMLESWSNLQVMNMSRFSLSPDAKADVDAAELCTEYQLQGIHE
jgi:hypothetical protein